MRRKERLLVFKASFYSDEFVLPENATEITFHYEASQVLVHHIFFWRQKSDSKHGQHCQSDFSQLLKQVMLLWKSMIRIFRRNQPQVVCKGLLYQLLAYGCFILISGANPTQSPGLRVQLLHWALLFVSQVTDPVLHSWKAQFKLYTSWRKKPQKHTPAQNPHPTKNSSKPLSNSMKREGRGGTSGGQSLSPGHQTLIFKN